jgi:uncharacterized protein (DUF362 family)
LAYRTTRRQFIRTTVASGTALALGVGCDADAPETPDPDATFADTPQGQVVLVRADAAAAVQRGLALMGGLTFIEAGQTVVLKPNFTGPLLPPDTTGPDVIDAMIRGCLDAGAGEVIVAERTFGPLNTLDVVTYPLYDNLSRSMLDVIEDAGGSFLPLDDEPWVEVHPDDADDYAEPLLVPALLDQADHIINVPAMKTHDIAVFTMAMKNLFGWVHPDTRNNQVHGHPDNDDDPDRPLRMFAQMNLAFDPILQVMDAMTIRTTGGPTPPGDTAETSLVILGKDRVAVDAVGLALLQVVGTEPHIEDRPVWDQVQLAEAARLGVGVSGPDEITLVGDGVVELGEIEERLRVT